MSPCSLTATAAPSIDPGGICQKHVHEHPSRWAAQQSFASKISCTTQPLSTWVRRAEDATDPRRNAALAGRERLKQWSGRSLSSDGQMRFCAGRPRFSLRRSSTAAGSDVGVHRRPSRSLELRQATVERTGSEIASPNLQLHRFFKH